jgi:preprotein translocase subunit SecG
MTIEQEQISEKQVDRIDHYNPVTVTLTEVTGVMAVSIIALILLFALLRSQKRIRDLQQQQANSEEG